MYLYFFSGSFYRILSKYEMCFTSFPIKYSTFLDHILAFFNLKSIFYIFGTYSDVLVYILKIKGLVNIFCKFKSTII